MEFSLLVAAAVLKVLCLSDIHMNPAFPERLKGFDDALALADEQGVDGILIAGDFTDEGKASQLKLAADIWRKHFPQGKRSDGGTIEKLFALGDHDRAMKEHRIAPEEYEALFGEKWSPVIVKTVKGHPFVLASHIYWKENKAMVDADALSATLDGLKGKRPYFYVQHWMMPWTTAGGRETNRAHVSWMGRDNGDSYKILKKHPGGIAFFGHCHENVRREDIFFPGPPFPCLELPTLKPTKDERAEKQGVMMNVYKDKIVFERLNTATGQKIASDWIVPLEAPNKE